MVVKNPSDFIGACLGKSEAQTRAILATTVGKVLIIDEAYMLSSGGHDKQHDSFKDAVINTLVAEVQGVPGDNRCVLILGHEDKLKEMFRNVNPGLSRRFPISHPFRFEDFDLPELMEVLNLKLKEQDLIVTDKALLAARGVLGRARMRPNFSNGGEVETCLHQAKLQYLARRASTNAPLEPKDFDQNYQPDPSANENIRDILNGRISEDIIAKLEGYQKLAAAAKGHDADPRREVPTNFVFKGPPG